MSPYSKIDFMILRSIWFREQLRPLLCGQLIFRKEIVHDESRGSTSFRMISIIRLSRLIKPSQVRQIVVELVLALDMVGGERHIWGRAEKRREHRASETTIISFAIFSDDNVQVFTKIIWCRISSVIFTCYDSVRVDGVVVEYLERSIILEIS
ncbi:hypothetical protein NY2A_b219L [Paramecium bursaria Chlorella virus NY2A]|uniref:Uncharacterized protein b219L n=1 Tax=Paramecium bursaria Chlorella virus NY2A TaxID=46021 RepID=A7IW94_PBCVN|nr:hypothetical protein NY2A_b219L [Paramecium bursaria Chlorella virus NY2A]ABT14618.1 hypothetical protein NY2A_b219L [Paramecium bursaria Chlorella virus NY2A]